MGSLNEDMRTTVADLARRHIDGELSWTEFFDSLPDEAEDSDDELICELIDLIQHTPAADGIFPSARRIRQAWEENLARVLKSIGQCA